MTAASINPNISYTHDLANWLVVRSNEHSTTSQIQYHLIGRVFLVGTSLLSLAEAAGRVALSCIAFTGYLLTLSSVQQIKNFSIDQLQKGTSAASIGLSCLRALASPQELINFLTAPQSASDDLIDTDPTTEEEETPSPVVELPGQTSSLLRSQRVRQGAEVIAGKLQNQFNLAQQQATAEIDKAFQYLPAPANFLGLAHTENVAGTEVGVCHYIGRRPEMEDEHLTTTFNITAGGRVYPIKLFGVFDGHGGAEASLYVKANLEHTLQTTLNQFCNAGFTDEAIWNALKITFVKLKDRFLMPQSGTTATIAIILDGKLWTANVGDSRTILDNGTQLSEDAKPTDPRYRKGIEKRGGRVFFQRVNGNLATARAIGDHNIGAVSARPKITVYPLSTIPTGTHLILTCDGIYDVASTRQVAAAVQAHKNLPASELARNIVYSAFTANSMDNLTALVVKL